MVGCRLSRWGLTVHRDCEGVIQYTNGVSLLRMGKNKTLNGCSDVTFLVFLSSAYTVRGGASTQEAAGLSSCRTPRLSAAFQGFVAELSSSLCIIPHHLTSQLPSKLLWLLDAGHLPPSLHVHIEKTLDSTR